MRRGVDPSDAEFMRAQADQMAKIARDETASPAERVEAASLIRPMWEAAERAEAEQERKG